MAEAKKLDLPTPPPQDAPPGLDELVAEIVADAQRDPVGYARDTRVPEGCE